MRHHQTQSVFLNSDWLLQEDDKRRLESVYKLYRVTLHQLTSSQGPSGLSMVEGWSFFESIVSDDDVKRGHRCIFEHQCFVMWTIGGQILMAHLLRRSRALWRPFRLIIVASALRSSENSKNKKTPRSSTDFLDDDSTPTCDDASRTLLCHVWTTDVVGKQHFLLLWRATREKPFAVLFWSYFALTCLINQFTCWEVVIWLSFEV